VIRIGELRCRVSLTPRTMTAAHSEAVLQSIRSSRFFERDKVLYQMRRKYVKTAAGLDKPSRPVLMPDKSAHVRASREAEERVPLLCIGNWQQPRESQGRKLVVETEREEEKGTLHRLPASMRAGERAKAVISVKSLELEAKEQQRAEAAFLQSDAYKSCLAMFSAPHSPTGSITPLDPCTPPSPPAVELQTQRLSARRCEGNCGGRTKDACLRTHTAFEAQTIPKFTSITPQMRAVEQPAVSAFPSHTPLRLHKASKSHSKALDFRHTLALEPVTSIPSEPVLSQPARLSLGLKSVMVELRPKNLPPHRIAVEYGLFRKVYKQRK
jgi:hypothetical protein